jgi:hypothetical protein
MNRRDHHAKPPPLRMELAAPKPVMPKPRDPKRPEPVPPKHRLPK